ncbi:MAG TPA: glycan-binding surface protein [Puia sp.]|nr:glycan-binding surface protein [Puia sp.]
MKKLLLFCIVALAVFELACKKNNSGGTPVITHVRSVNPAEADSFFTQAQPGALIVIQGSGFEGLQQVWFNDSLASVNLAYVTNNNIVISIPAGTQTSATNPKVTNQIKVVTNHGTALFNFSIVLNAPVISAITFDNTGKVLYIQGTNLVGISKITFPIGATGNYDTATGYTVNSTWTQIVAGVPTGAAWQDSLRVYCTFGTASYPFPPPMTITSVSNENALPGDSIVLKGTNFIGVTSITFPGGVTVTPTVFSVSQLGVTVPAGITGTDTLRINSALLGNASATQLFDSYLTHPSPGYLSIFDGDYNTDNTGFVGWTGGYGTTPSTTYPNGTGSFGILDNAGAMGGNTQPGGNEGNPGFLQLNDVPWVSNTSVAAANYSLKFEVYVAAPWKAGAIWVMAGDWYGWQHYVARVAPWDTAAGGVFQPTGWYTITVPLSQFINPVGATSVIANGTTQAPVTDPNEWDYGSFPVGGNPPNKISDFGTTALCFTLVNDQSSPSVPANGLNVAIDNVRIVQGR